MSSDNSMTDSTLSDKILAGVAAIGTGTTTIKVSMMAHDVAIKNMGYERTKTECSEENCIQQVYMTSTIPDNQLSVENARLISDGMYVANAGLTLLTIMMTYNLLSHPKRTFLESIHKVKNIFEPVKHTYKPGIDK